MRTEAADVETTEPFPIALRELVTESDYVTQDGKPNWAALASELEGLQYETLRQAATGRRRATPRLIVECARALRVAPEYFLEYRLHLARCGLDPSVVGHERAVENLARWMEARADSASLSEAGRVQSPRRRTRKQRK